MLSEEIASALFAVFYTDSSNLKDTRNQKISIDIKRRTKQIDKIMKEQIIFKIHSSFSEKNFLCKIETKHGGENWLPSNNYGRTFI